MLSSVDLTGAVAAHFASTAQHTAEVLAGPKRETWFSAETFVALSHASPPDPVVSELPLFSCWGEEEYKTVFAKVAAPVPAPPGGKPKRRPDIVCFLPRDGVDAITVILELKVVLKDEDPGPGLLDLKGQLQNARLMAPKAPAIGLVFLALAPCLTPGTFEKAAKALRARIEQELPDTQGFAWVGGFDVKTVFAMVPTRFHYPAMSVSLAVCARAFT